MANPKHTQPKRSVGEGSKVRDYGSSKIYYGTNEERTEKFVRDAAGEKPAPEYNMNRRTEIAQWKMDYLGYGDDVHDAPRKFARLDADQKAEANEAWKRHSLIDERLGEGKIEVKVTYQLDNGKYRTLKVGQEEIGEGNVTFRAKDFLDFVYDEYDGDLYGALDDLWGDADDAEYGTGSGGAAVGAPVNIQIISGAAAGGAS